MLSPGAREVYDSVTAHFKYGVDMNIYASMAGGEKWLHMNGGQPAQRRYVNFNHDHSPEIRSQMESSTAERLTLAPSSIRIDIPPTRKIVPETVQNPNAIQRIFRKTIIEQRVEEIYNPPEVRLDVRRDVVSGKEVPFSQIAYALGAPTQGNLLRPQQKLSLASYVPTAMGESFLDIVQEQPVVIRSLALGLREYVLHTHGASANELPYNEMPSDWQLAIGRKPSYEVGSKFDITYVTAGSETIVPWLPSAEATLSASAEIEIAWPISGADHGADILVNDRRRFTGNL